MLNWPNKDHKRVTHFLSINRFLFVADKKSFLCYSGWDFPTLIWIIGFAYVYDSEQWALLASFIYSKNILERVLADFNLYVNKYLACDKLQIVRLTEVDLLVGPGNFKPVKSLSLSLPLRSPWMFKILFIHAQSKLASLYSNLISKSSFHLILTFFRWKSTNFDNLIFLFINVYFYLNTN